MYDYGFAGQYRRMPTGGPTAAEAVTNAAEAANLPVGAYVAEQAQRARDRMAARLPVRWEVSLVPIEQIAPALGELAVGPASQDAFFGLPEVPPSAFVLPSEFPLA